MSVLDLPTITKVTVQIEPSQQWVRRRGDIREAVELDLQRHHHTLISRGSRVPALRIQRARRTSGTFAPGWIVYGEVIPGDADVLGPARSIPNDWAYFTYMKID